MSSLRIAAAAALGLAALCLAPAPARADDGDPAGWSVRTDPRKRAFLIATDREGGPRLLTIACLRDVDSFAIYSAGIPGLVAGDATIDLTLAVADAEFVLSGTAELDRDTGAVGFSGEHDLGAAGRKAVGRELLPVLTAPGPVVVTIGSAPSVEIPLEPMPPRAGIAGPLKTFEKICFGR